MPDAGSLARPTETSVRDERHLQPHACDDGRRIQHLLHAGASLRAFVAYDDDITVMNLTRHDGVDAGLFRGKTFRRSLIDEHIFSHS